LEYAIKNNEEVKDLLRTSPALEPLLLPSTRGSAFKYIDADGDAKLSMKELLNLSHVAREHADREYVAHRSNGKDPIICDSYLEMKKVMKYDQNENEKLQKIRADERKTRKTSGMNQPKVIVPKRAGVLTDKQIKQRAKERDIELKRKFQEGLKRTKAEAAKKKYFEKSRISNQLKGEVKQGARAAALRAAAQAEYVSSEEEGEETENVRV
jgi:hypothetical protein